MSGASLVKNEAGHVYGRLTVERSAGSDYRCQHMHWLCRCSCGQRVRVSGVALRQGTVRSCGCFQRERLLPRFKTLNAANTPRVVNS
jgi:hypothetical protein